MMPYAFVIDKSYLSDAFEVTKFINRKIKAKIKGKDNFTYFNEAYYKKKIKQARKRKAIYIDLKQKGYINDSSDYGI